MKTPSHSNPQLVAQYLSIEQVAARLRTSAATVRRHVDAGELKAIRWFGRVVFLEEDVERFAKQDSARRVR